MVAETLLSHLLGALDRATHCHHICSFFAMRFYPGSFIERLIDIKSIKVASRAPGISNLLYADDVLLFYGAQHSEVSALMKCVEKYFDWSGQVVSRDKSGIFVSKGVHSQFVQYIKNQWGFKLLLKGVKYLGMPLFISPNKTKDFSFVKEKLESRISG